MKSQNKAAKAINPDDYPVDPVDSQFNDTVPGEDDPEPVEEDDSEYDIDPPLKEENDPEIDQLSTVGREKPKPPTMPQLRPSLLPRLNMPRLQEAQFGRTEWLVTLEPGVKFSTLLVPTYWTHVAKKLKPWDKIAVRTEDSTFYAELLVVYAGKFDAKVKEIAYLDLGGIQQEVTPDLVLRDHIVKYGGPRTKWRVIRREDGVILRDGFNQQHDAKSWLDVHLKRLNS